VRRKRTAAMAPVTSAAAAPRATPAPPGVASEPTHVRASRPAARATVKSVAPGQSIRPRRSGGGQAGAAAQMKMAPTTASGAPR